MHRRHVRQSLLRARVRTRTDIDRPSAALVDVEEPRLVGAVIADSSFYDFREVLSGEITRRTGLPPIFAPAITVFADLLYGLNLNQIQPFQHLAEIAPRPVFYIHQEGDPRIRADHSIRLKAAGANPADELWIVPGITHARAFEQEPAAYAERMLRFFRDHLK